MMHLERPIIILGAVRSGTTLLGNILKEHPAIAYWEEPKHIWRHRHAYRRHDVLTAADATPAVKRYITTQFAHYLEVSGKQRFAEKTPSNCLRVPFVREIFPDAQFIHLIRDGRASALSARVQWMNDYLVANVEADAEMPSNTSYRQPVEPAGVLSGLREFGVTVRKFMVEKRRLAGGMWTFIEAPAYIPSLLRVLARKMTTQRSFIWGTRFPGIQDTHRAYTLLETCALQWAYSVQSVLMHTRDLPPTHYLELRYENMTAAPEETLRQVMAFAGLAESQTVLELAARRMRPDSGRWRERLTLEESQLLEGWLGPLLRQLNYK